MNKIKTSKKGKIKKPLISIIIPTYNEEKYIGLLLESINVQTFKDYEVIIADANSKDKTIEICKKYNTKIVKGGIPSIGRNNGAKIAKGKILMFIDADCILPFDFLENSLKEFKRKKLDCATTKIYPLTTKLFDYFIFKTVQIIQLSLKNIKPKTFGAFIMIKKDLFDKINGFDESKEYSEDHDLVQRSSKYGKYGILKTFMFTSIRRFEKEGRIKYFNKIIKIEFNELLKLNLDVDYFNKKNKTRKKNKN